MHIQYTYNSFSQLVIRAIPHIGLLHRATEKLIEHKTYTQVHKRSYMNIISHFP